MHQVRTQPPLRPRDQRTVAHGICWWLGMALVAGCTPAPSGEEEDPSLVSLRQRGIPLAGEVSSPQLVPPVPHDPEVRPVLNGLPAHYRFVLPFGANADSLVLLALPVAEYRRHYLGGARAGLDRRLGALRDIIAAAELRVDGEIPVFPQPLAAQRFRARLQWMNFEGGQGVAFVTQFSDDASPPGQDKLVWVFQGLSMDGAWLLATIHPLVVSHLPGSEDPRRVAAGVDTLPPESFTPDPELLRHTLSRLRIAIPPRREQ